MKVSVKKSRVYFKTKKGDTKYTRFTPKMTDANGATTTKIKVSYNKKKGQLILTPNKSWWNSKKRKYPIEIRSNYLTAEHERDVKVGAAYTGASDATYGFDKSLLVQPKTCVPYIKMELASELKQPNVQVRDARLFIHNEENIQMGAGKTFDIAIHKVLENWSVNKLSYSNQAVYEDTASSVISLTNAGLYDCDITGVVASWCSGETPFGVALVAMNGNKTYQARLDRNPYVAVNYEIVNYDGAVELKENAPITQKIVTSGQEGYYYFDGDPNLTYDVYCESAVDMQATMYDIKKNRLAYDDDSGLNHNFLFSGKFDGRRYIKVSGKSGQTGEYTMYLKQRFGVPAPVGVKGQDKYTISWSPVANAKEYLVTIYDANGKKNEVIVSGTSYDYIYTSGDAGATLGFTVTARENDSTYGAPSRMIYSRASLSDWGYGTPMQAGEKGASAVAFNKNIYVLGGENSNGASSSFLVYDTTRKEWSELPSYPGSSEGICNAAMTVLNGEIYVIGGQTNSSANARLLNQVYSFNPEAKTWTQRKEMSEGRTNLRVAVSNGKIYTFSQLGSTERIDSYDPTSDVWNSNVKAAVSNIVNAVNIDNRIFLLRGDNGKMYMQEYFPEDDSCGEAGTVCPYGETADYKFCAVYQGKIYMAKAQETNQIIYYDVYTNSWGETSGTNLVKTNSTLVAVGDMLYSIGGEMRGFGILDVVEQYSIKDGAISRCLSVEKDEEYEIQVNAGNIKESEDKVITLSVNPDEIEIEDVSSFEMEEDLNKGTDRVKLLTFEPEKGLMVLKIKGGVEQGDTYEAVQSVPLKAKVTGTTTISMTQTNQE